MAQKKIFGKVLDLIGLEESAIDEEDNYDDFDDYQDDDYQDDYDNYEDEDEFEDLSYNKKESSRIGRKNNKANKRKEKNNRRARKDEYDLDLDNDFAEDEEEEFGNLGRNGLLGSKSNKRSVPTAAPVRTRERDRDLDQSSKVVGFNPKMKMIVYQPMSYDDTQNIVDNLKRNKPVIVNLEAVEKQEAQRTLDFISGAIYAINGDIQKINSAVFVLVPTNVDISGNIPDDLKGKSFYTLNNQRRDY